MGGELIINEDFSDGMDNWWVEGGDDVRVADGRIVIRADNTDAIRTTMCTVWCKTPHPDQFVLELDAHVLGSSIRANNINLFFCFSDPGGKELYETRQERSSADYELYHPLTGNIITFLNDWEAESGRLEDGSTRARTRIRSCPGFDLLTETYGGRCRIGETYHVKITRAAGEIVFEVDGNEMLRANDPRKLVDGLFGLRTFRTELWFDNITLRRID